VVLLVLHLRGDCCYCVGLSSQLGGLRAVQRCRSSPTAMSVPSFDSILRCCCCCCCLPLQGLEVGAQLLSSAELGAAVCKFSPEKLAPVMAQLLDVLNKQSKASLANLPAFADLLTSTKPEVLMVRPGCPPTSNATSCGLPCTDAL
jgi:hypothetical protein